MFEVDFENKHPYLNYYQRTSHYMKFERSEMWSVRRLCKFPATFLKKTVSATTYGDIRLRTQAADSKFKGLSSYFM